MIEILCSVRTACYATDSTNAHKETVNYGYQVSFQVSKLPNLDQDGLDFWAWVQGHAFSHFQPYTDDWGDLYVFDGLTSYFINPSDDEGNSINKAFVQKLLDEVALDLLVNNITIEYPVFAYDREGNLRILGCVKVKTNSVKVGSLLREIRAFYQQFPSEKLAELDDARIRTSTPTTSTSLLVALFAALP